MRYHDISLDELEELEQEIHFQAENTQGDLDYSKIELYDAMHNHLKLLAAEDADYAHYYTYIQQKLINYLLCYCGQAASNDANKRYAAEQAMKKVLQYDPVNPLAAYRLGGLFHQQHMHAEALCQLQQALDNQSRYPENAYQLNADQVKRALLHMSSSSLHIGSRAFAASSVSSTALDSADFSEMFTELCRCTDELRNSAYRILSADEHVQCGHAQVVAAIEKDPKDTIILFFNTDGPELIYNGIREKLPAAHAFLLKHLLLHSCAEKPMKPLDAKAYFLDTHVMTGVTGPTFTKAVEGMMQALREIEIPSAICRADAGNQPAYYFNGTSAYMVIGRVDEELNFG